MKKLFITLLLTLLVFLLVNASWERTVPFLDSTISLNAGATKTNVTNFTSAEIYLPNNTLVGTAVTFTRAAGSASTLDANFEVSYDGGRNWATFEGATFSTATNHSVISGTTVSVFKIYNVHGVSHIRLKSLVNNDGANNLTAVNVFLSM